MLLQVLYESEELEARDSSLISQRLPVALGEIMRNSFSPEVLGCPNDENVVSTSVMKSCLSTLDSRNLYIIAAATSKCRQNTSMYQDSTWKATINLITEEIDFEDLCRLK